MSDFIVDYMVNKKWELDNFHEEKNKVLNILKKISKKSDMITKLGGVLLSVQLEELLLKEAIEISNNYIKAEIWPSKVNLYVDLNEKTFGNLITYFKNNAVEVHNNADLIYILNVHKDLRNKIVHNIFLSKGSAAIEADVNRIIEEAIEVMSMLLDYYDQVCFKLYDLSERVIFSTLIEE